jgi:hypothetical protein
MYANDFEAIGNTGRLAPCRCDESGPDRWALSSGVVAFFAELANREIGVPGVAARQPRKERPRSPQTRRESLDENYFEKPEPPKKKRFPLRR